MSNTVDLTKRRSTPAMSAEEFRRHGHRLIDDIAAFLESIPSGPVTKGLTPGDVKALVATETPLPETGSAPDMLLARALQLLGPDSLVDIRLERNQIIIEPIRNQEYVLSQLLGGIKSRNLHPEIDFGSAGD